MERNEIKQILKKILTLFTTGDYETLFALDKAQGISPQSLKEAIEDYGGTLTMPPDEELENFDLFEEDDEYLPSDYFIDFDFWVDNKRSDLTLKATIFNNGDFEIRDIRIL